MNVNFRRKRDALEKLKKMAYWKQDEVDPKIEKIFERMKRVESMQRNTIFTNPRSYKILKNTRKGKKVEDVIDKWAKMRDIRKKKIEDGLKPVFKPQLNRKSLKMISEKRAKSNSQLLL